MSRLKNSVEEYLRAYMNTQFSCMLYSCLGIYCFNYLRTYRQLDISVVKTDPRAGPGAQLDYRYVEQQTGERTTGESLS